MDSARGTAGERREVLMMWRHRFITDTWAWELPMGLVEDGETPAEAAAREVLEETGWRPGPVMPLVYAEPAAGITTTPSTRSSGPTARRTRARRPRRTSRTASSGSPSPEVRAMIDRREIVSGATLVGLLHILTDEAFR